MTLNDILHGAQGGQAVANLGAQFGLAPEAAEAAVQAMIPAFSAGLTSMAPIPPLSARCSTNWRAGRTRRRTPIPPKPQARAG
jgi:hypothetical protein